MVALCLQLACCPTSVGDPGSPRDSKLNDQEQNQYSARSDRGMFQKMEKNATDAHSSIVPFRDQKSDITMVLAVLRAGPGGGTGKIDGKFTAP
jgi:hypothetical protein